MSLISRVMCKLLDRLLFSRDPRVSVNLMRGIIIYIIKHITSRERERERERGVERERGGERARARASA